MVLLGVHLLLLVVNTLLLHHTNCVLQGREGGEGGGGGDELGMFGVIRVWKQRGIIFPPFLVGRRPGL